MRLAIVLGLVAVICTAIVSPAGAGSNPDMELAIVAQPHEMRACGGVFRSCADMQYEYDGTGSYDLLVVAYNFTGLTAVSYALDYSNIEDAVFGSFMSCATLSYTCSQSPGVYDLVQAWSTCQAPPAGGGVTIGWIELWGGEGRLDIRPSICEEGIVAVDCSFQADIIMGTHPGLVGGALPRTGDTSPCGIPLAPLAVEEATWGGVKSLYR